MAGYSGATRGYREAAFGEGVGPILRYDFFCDGDEDDLFDCPFGTHSDGFCSHYEDAGVICSTDIIRLSDGSPSAGRVELFINGQWGTICDDNWDINDAIVICRQLGFDRAANAYDMARFGPGKGPIHFDEVQCAGSETDILLCNTKSIHDCEHSEDAAVSCVSDSFVTPSWLKPFNSILTKGCKDYWFQNDNSCITVIHTEHSTTLSELSCPEGSSVLSVDTEVGMLGEYLRIIYYYYEEITLKLFLWQDGKSKTCTFFNRTGDNGDTWDVISVPAIQCNDVYAYVCKMDIEDQSQTCSNNQFRCLSGACILKSLQCDGNFDCPDKSDEDEQCIQECSDSLDGHDYRGTKNNTTNGIRCIKWTSNFKGTDAIYPVDYIGKGIGDHNFCRNPNGRQQPWCYTEDFYEVEDCEIPLCGECSSGFLRCSDGKCLHPKFKCDRIRDCPTGIDEPMDEPNNCQYTDTKSLCNQTEMVCANGICIDQRHLCLLDYDVYSDDVITGCRDRSHLQHCASFECPANTYKCPSSYCITIKSRCDGRDDCENGEDEQYCEDYNCPGYFKCQDASNCISQGRVCDGIKDCLRGDDELFCDIQCPNGCFCQDLSYNCHGVEWTAEKAALISPDVRYLYMQGNDISSLEGDVFQDLKQLKYLNIHGNGLKSIGKGTFFGLSKLQYLNMSGNNIGNVDKLIFKDLMSLKTLISDDYSFCCLLEDVGFNDVDCTPDADVFSSCDNLMQNVYLRAFLWLFGLSALLGNSFVILWRWINWPAKKSPSYTQSFLITNLAVADMLMGLYMLIIASADSYYREDYVTHDSEWKASRICTLAGILAFLSSESSVYTLTVISCDRFLHIAFPFRRFHLTQETVKFAVAVGWFLTLFTSILPALPIPYFNNEYYGVTSVCLALPLTSEKVRGWEYTAAIFIGFNSLCFLLIFVCYSGVFILIKISSSKVNQAGNMNSDKNKHIAIAIRMAVIVATDFCCWVPIIIMGILSLTTSVNIPATVYAWAAVFILPINSAINPYLYTIASLKKLQRQLKPSKHVSESMPATERINVKIEGVTIPQNRKEQSTVEKIEAMLSTGTDRHGKELDADVRKHLSMALRFAKQQQAGIVQVEVEDCVESEENTQEESEDTTQNQTQDETQERSEYCIGVEDCVESEENTQEESEDTSQNRSQDETQERSKYCIGVSNPAYDNESYVTTSLTYQDDTLFQH
ncbi:uncharacterized protein [Antedon mediterranea]|uniref:uncharacterized protein n=1 Tax=Antedon mediterranea TaxID=105859 RepID=UPI003AF58713